MEFKVGDVVRIRQWDDMLNEYGKDSDGDIVCSHNTIFCSSMKYLCGKIFIIEGFDDEQIYGLDEADKDGWKIIPEMLEPAVLDDTPLNDDISNINEYLLGFSIKRGD